MQKTSNEIYQEADKTENLVEIQGLIEIFGHHKKIKTKMVRKWKRQKQRVWPVVFMELETNFISALDCPENN